jgi:hypothetical protein
VVVSGWWIPWAAFTGAWVARAAHDYRQHRNPWDMTLETAAIMALASGFYGVLIMVLT